MVANDPLLERQAEICKALGNTKRLQIIYLLQEGEVAAGNLAQALNTTAANVSQHLNAMRQAGLVDSRREANNIFYWLSSPAILDACRMVKSVLEEQLHKEQQFLNRSL